MGLLSRLTIKEGEQFSVNKEILAGITTFLAMAYIIFVNPAIVGGGFEFALRSKLQLETLTPELQALVNNVKVGIATATILAAAFGSLVMGFYARLPFALAPGMGENVFIGFSVIPAFAAALITLGFSGVDAVTTAMFAAFFAVFVNGLLFLLASWSGIRERVIRSISPSLAYGIAVGIGIFIAFIGLALADIVKPGVGTPVQFNDKAFLSPSSILAIAGFFVASALYFRKFSPNLLLIIIALTIIGIVLTETGIAPGLVALPPQIFQYPSFSTSIVPNFGNTLSAYLAIITIAFPVALALFIVSFFDAIGSITGLAAKAGLMDEKSKPLNIDKALYTDSTAIIAGALAGTTTTVVYIESAAGIETGGRTGLTAAVTGLLFLLFLPIAPLAVVIPGFATAPVLLLVGLMFISLIRKVDLEDLTEAIPSFVAIIGIPLTYNIATGIGLAFITYTIVKVLTGRFKDISLTTILITIAFIIYFAALPYLH